MRTLAAALVLVLTAGLVALAPALAGPSAAPAAPVAPVAPVAPAAPAGQAGRVAVETSLQLASTVVPKAPTSSPATRRLDISRALRRMQRRMLVAVNLARSVPQTCGKEVLPAVGPLRSNKRLSRAAQKYAKKMARNDWFDHDAPDGTDPGERILDEGYRWSRWGENIAAGYDGVGEVVAAWLESPGHCRTLMGSFRHVGFGHAFAKGSTYGHYWVQDFASPE